MATPLPGLNLMRTFEVAGRLSSFTKAAGELHVTPAAVSYQMRALEDQLGVKLFARTSRVVRLTPAGEILLAGVGEALDGIGRTIARIGTMDGRPQLNVTTSPSFAAKWLVPRLHDFLQRYPEADVRMNVSEGVVDLSRGEADLAVRFGNGNYPGLQIDRLFEETIFPVCSPKLLKGKHPLRQPRGLKHHTLIHVEWRAQGATWPDWRMWLLAAGIRDLDPMRGLRFTQTSIALQAAIEGQGVALSESTLVADDLASGRLVRPFTLTVKGPAQFGYYALTTPAGAERPLVKAFRRWLIDQAGLMKAQDQN
jgi:LysR family glycine cleavage system transcriptional activator